jgi:hypothetical protein
MFRGYLFCLFLMACGHSGVAQTNKPLLFKAVPLPEPWSPLVYRLNKAVDYSVRKKGGRLVTGLGHETRTTELITTGGTFRGVDHGEFGGVLLFQSADKQSQPVEIKRGNVRLIFQLQGRIYFIEGLAHLSLSHGALYELTGQAPHFEYTKLADFDDAPEAFAIMGDDVYMAQSKGFTLLRHLRPDVIVKNTFWGGLYPNSVAVFGDTAYVGMRGGYTRVIIPSKSLTFFKHIP